jgi:hypothetical protein
MHNTYLNTNNLELSICKALLRDINLYVGFHIFYPNQLQW